MFIKFLKSLKRKKSRVKWRYIFIFLAVVMLQCALLSLLANEQIYKIKKYKILPDDSLHTLSPEDMGIMEQRMKKRRNHLKQKCSDYELDVPRKRDLYTPNLYQFFVNRKYHLIWCNVFKAAASSWMYNFNILAGYTPEFIQNSNTTYFDLARKKYRKVTIDQLKAAQNDSITFIIARHPFERLLSAYRDRFVIATPDFSQEKIRNSIIRTYRKNVSEWNTPKYPTFSEFVNWMLDSVRNPYFFDQHLIQSTKFCTPCLINFDVIAKFETLEQDQLYLIQKAGLQNIIKTKWENRGQWNDKLELQQMFYSQLTRKQLDGLYSYYRYDFEIFGYDSATYYNIVKNEEQLPAEKKRY